MSRLFVAAALLLALWNSACAPRPATVDGGLLGRMLLFSPGRDPAGVVFLVSDERGWSRRMTGLAEHLRARGLIVIGVDAVRVMANLAASADQCVDVREAFEQASQQIQKSLNLGTYVLPTLAGIGRGGTLALAALWQAGPETFAGAATVDVAPALPDRPPLCADPPAEPLADGSGYRYPTPQHLYGWWQLAWSKPPTAAARAFAATAGMELPPHAEARTPEQLLTALLDHSTAEQIQEQQEMLKLGDLPVIDLPGHAGTRSIAVIYSGDGGWRDLDRSLGDILADAGVRVIGVDCLRYFWSQKSPEDAAHDLNQLLDQLRKQVPHATVALVGYSFGADVLPFLYNRLDATTKESVSLLSLLAPGRDAHFEIHMAGWIGADPQQDATPLRPELAAIDPRLLQCMYGEEEADDTGCLDAHLEGADVIRTLGGHHFDGDYQLVAQRILSRLSAAK